MNTLSRILVVDDDERFRTNMVKLLGSQGYGTDEAGSGEEALDKLKQDGFDVILLDVKMPGLTGVATMKRIRETGCEAAVIFLTGNASVDDALEGINLGAADYLLKPIKTEKLVEKINKILHKNG